MTSHHLPVSSTQIGRRMTQNYLGQSFDLEIVDYSEDPH